MPNLHGFVLLLSFQYCYISAHRHESTYYGTKTIYKAENLSIEYPERCRPVHVQYLSRHGSRYPSGGNLESIDKLLKFLATTYKETGRFQYKNLSLPWKRWNDWKDKMTSELSWRGEEEQFNIARRFRQRFSGIFDKSYWNKYYKFIARDKRRTSQSAVAFAMGLFEGRGMSGMFICITLYTSFINLLLLDLTFYHCMDMIQVYMSNSIDVT